MSLLDDARELAGSTPTYSAPACGHDVPDECDPHEDCHYCDAALFGARCQILGDHEPHCPWNSMPKIIAALEAAERLVAMGENGPWPNEACWFCADWRVSIESRLPGTHKPDCRWAVLVAALKGDQN